jgi:hypothetical protein
MDGMIQISLQFSSLISTPVAGVAADETQLQTIKRLLGTMGYTRPKIVFACQGNGFIA